MVDVKDKFLLVISDSFILFFFSNVRWEELGYVGYKGNKSGFSVYLVIVLDVEYGVCYGLGGIFIYKVFFVWIVE